MGGGRDSPRDGPRFGRFMAVRHALIDQRITPSKSLKRSYNPCLGRGVINQESYMSHT